MRSKERGTRARSSDGGDWRVLDSYTGKTRRGGGGAQRQVGWHPGLTWSFAAFFCLCFFFVLFFFSFAACYCHFLKFCCVFFSCRYRIRIRTNSSLFLTWKSSVRPLVISRDTSCDSVWPIKSSLHASDVAKGAEAEALQRRESVQFLRNYQTSSCFYQSFSHGLIQSSHQAFPYAELRRDWSKDGLHVSACELQDSWILGKLK